MSAHTRILLLLFLSTAILSLSACRFIEQPVAPAQTDQGVRLATDVPDALYTAAVQTVVAELTHAAASAAVPTASTAPSDTPLPPTPTPLPTDTPGPQITPTPTASPTATATPTSTSTPVPTATPELVFQDDFSIAQGWFITETDRFRFEYKNGAYIMFNNILNFPILSVRSFDYADVYLEVDATRIGGPTNGYFGLICRYQNNDNYYAMVIGSNGFYSIIRTEKGSITFLDQGIAPTDTIYPGDAVNKIGASCIGDTLSISANGKKLLEVQDETFDQGLIGLIVGTTVVPGENIRFDNFALFNPN